jgi:uncharacterized protein (TIGR04222 family)
MLTTATTWGITSAQFLTGYGLLCLTAAGAIRWKWDRAFGGQARGAEPVPTLDVYELALLAGGPQRAITSALVQLHRDDLLRIRRHERTLKVSGERPPAAPLERAIYHTVRREPDIGIEALRRQVKDGAELESMSARLVRDGLLLDDEQAAWPRRLWIVGALLVVLGLARIVGGLRHGASIGATAAIVVVVAAATFWLLRRRPPATQRGRATLERVRAERADLRDSPVAGESAMTLALFGDGALWVADPATAAALGVPREEDAHGRYGRGTGCGAGGGCSAGDAGGGGGCGGGGCGGGN